MLTGKERLMLRLGLSSSTFHSVKSENKTSRRLYIRRVAWISRNQNNSASFSRIHRIFVWIKIEFLRGWWKSLHCLKVIRRLCRRYRYDVILLRSCSFLILTWGRFWTLNWRTDHMYVVLTVQVCKASPWGTFVQYCGGFSVAAVRGYRQSCMGIPFSTLEGVQFDWKIPTVLWGIQGWNSRGSMGGGRTVTPT